MIKYVLYNLETWYYFRIFAVILKMLTILIGDEVDYNIDII